MPGLLVLFCDVDDNASTLTLRGDATIKENARTRTIAMLTFLLNGICVSFYS